jgi:hypothetical protein
VEKKTFSDKGLGAGGRSWNLRTLRERIFHRGLGSRGQIMNPNVLRRTVTSFPLVKFLRIHLLALKLRKQKFNLPFSL